jgi:hypothetical protein
MATCPKSFCTRTTAERRSIGSNAVTSAAPLGARSHSPKTAGAAISPTPTTSAPHRAKRHAAGNAKPTAPSKTRTAPGMTKNHGNRPKRGSAASAS